MPTKKELIEQLEELDGDYQSIVRDYNQARLDLYECRKATEQKKPKHASSFSVDLWPLSDWLRLSFEHYRPGRYFQICLGPLRFDFYEG